jgi:ectoine hydroxylase-related dioxygenase (phytanoyl-CoA dioxygenase family)
MIDFNKNPDLISLPWIETDFFYSQLKKKKISNEFKRHAIKFHEEGYCVVDLDLSQKIINKIIDAVNNLSKSKDVKLNPKIYHYNKSPRIIEGWKKSKTIKELALNKKILKLLSFFYRKKPIAINTINFIKGSDQPLHSDYIHFSSSPHKYLTAAWVALEDTNIENGPLMVVPRSHKLEIIDYSFFNMSTPQSMNELGKYYKIYETYIKQLVKEKKLTIKPVLMKKGQALIWAANLLHGGKKIIDPNSTRYSQVTHYHFENCNFYYNPGFSNPIKGEFAYRNLEKLRIN